MGPDQFPAHLGSGAEVALNRIAAAGSRARLAGALLLS